MAKVNMHNRRRMLSQCIQNIFHGLHEVLILADFLITQINEEDSSILFRLIKIGTPSTVVTCQYPADDCGDFMGNQN